MKYLSLVVLLGAMSWSWSLTRHKATIPEDIHVGIQEDLKRVIKEYIEKNLPNSQNLRFDRFWTEALSHDKVKASFLYSFDETDQAEGPANVQIEGFAILNRDKGKDQSKTDAVPEYWSFDELHVLNNQIEFKNPVTISPEAGH